jgi:hypothetical protein
LARVSPVTQAANVSLRERAAALRRENAHLRQALDAAQRTAQVERARADAAQESVRIWARLAVNQR